MFYDRRKKSDMQAYRFVNGLTFFLFSSFIECTLNKMGSPERFFLQFENYEN